MEFFQLSDAPKQSIDLRDHRLIFSWLPAAQIWVVDIYKSESLIIAGRPLVICPSLVKWFIKSIIIRIDGQPPRYINSFSAGASRLFLEEIEE